MLLKIALAALMGTDFFFPTIVKSPFPGVMTLIRFVGSTVYSFKTVGEKTFGGKIISE